MPILRERHMVETFRKLIDDRHHGVTLGNGERAARTEIILHVDNEEQVVGLDLHPRSCSKVSRPSEQKTTLSIPVRCRFGRMEKSARGSTLHSSNTLLEKRI